MFDDIGKTIKAILYDRITSPLFGTFLLSWCGWNWRLIALFITDSSMTVAKKFHYVDAELYPSNGVTFIYGLLLPLTTTAFFIYIYPWFAKKVYGHWREQQNKLKERQIEKDGKKPLTKEEAQEIQNQALLSELRYQDEREKREARIRDLENLVKTLQPEGKLVTVKESLHTDKEATKQSQKKVALKPKSYSADVQHGMFSVLRLIDEFAPGSLVSKVSFMNSVGSDKELSKQENIFILHCLDNLIAEGYVNESSNHYLYVQPKGRTSLLNRKFNSEIIESKGAASQ